MTVKRLSIGPGEWFQSPFGEVVKETFIERSSEVVLLFQSPFGEVVKET